MWSLQEPKSVTPESNKSFEELVLDEMKGPTNKPAVKRRKVDLKAKVVTDASYLKELQRLEKEAEDKLNKKKTQQRSSKAKSRINFDDDSDDFSDDDPLGEILVPLDDSEDEAFPEPMDVLVNNDETALKELWKSLSPPASEESIAQKWYGVIYDGKKKSHLYVGKATRRFLDDVDGPVEGIEFDCLKPHVGTGTILLSVPEHLQRDVDIFPLRNIIDGPLKVIPLKGESGTSLNTHN